MGAARHGDASRAASTRSPRSGARGDAAPRALPPTGGASTAVVRNSPFRRAILLCGRYEASTSVVIGFLWISSRAWATVLSRRVAHLCCSTRSRGCRRVCWASNRTSRTVSRMAARLPTLQRPRCSHRWRGDQGAGGALSTAAPDRPLAPRAVTGADGASSRSDRGGAAGRLSMTRLTEARAICQRLFDLCPAGHRRGPGPVTGHPTPSTRWHDHKGETVD